MNDRERQQQAWMDEYTQLVLQGEVDDTYSERLDAHNEAVKEWEAFYFKATGKMPPKNAACYTNMPPKVLPAEAVPPEPDRKARRAQRKAARRAKSQKIRADQIERRKAAQARRAARYSYYVVNAGRGRSSTHIMRSTSPRTPNPASPGGIAAELLWFGGSAKNTLCGLAATRYVDVFSPSQASCRECKARWQARTRTPAVRPASSARPTVAEFRAAKAQRKPAKPITVYGLTQKSADRKLAALVTTGKLAASDLTQAQAARLRARGMLGTESALSSPSSTPGGPARARS